MTRKDVNEPANPRVPQPDRRRRRVDPQPPRRDVLSPRPDPEGWRRAQ